MSKSQLKEHCIVANLLLVQTDRYTMMVSHRHIGTMGNCILVNATVQNPLFVVLPQLCLFRLGFCISWTIAKKLLFLARWVPTFYLYFNFLPFSLLYSKHGKKELKHRVFLLRVHHTDQNSGIYMDHIFQQNSEDLQTVFLDDLSERDYLFHLLGFPSKLRKL